MGISQPIHKISKKFLLIIHPKSPRVIRGLGQARYGPFPNISAHGLFHLQLQLQASDFRVHSPEPSLSLAQTHMAPPRILLCGDVLGRLNQLFKRVSSVSLSLSMYIYLGFIGSHSFLSSLFSLIR